VSCSTSLPRCQCNGGNGKSVPRRQHGVALVLALLVVALVTAITVELSWRFDLSMIRSANRWHGVQANAYLNGAEELAFMLLREDADKDKQEGKEVDTLYEDWAGNYGQIPTDEGWVRGRLEDAQARFNINLLAKKAPKPNANKSQEPWQKWTAPQRRFIRLLQTLELAEEEFLDQATAENITEAIMDWIDVDSEVTGFGGAESDYYGQLDIPFVVANKPMVSVSELNVIKGIFPVLYQKLLPLVIALPAEATTNVNTMPLELIRSINSKKVLYPITVEDAMYIFEERGAGYDDVEMFKSGIVKDVVDSSGNGNNLDTEGLGVNSSYFIFYGDTMVGDIVRESKALFFREGAEVKTLRRSDANF